MALIGNNRVCSSLFHWDSSSKTFSQEISCIATNLFGRIYDDACDTGFIMVSEKTGKEEHMCLYETQTDRDGDVCGWVFLPVNPKLDFKVLVFND